MPPSARVTRGLARLLNIPAPTAEVTVRRGLRVPMRDGVDLVADLYAPAAGSAVASRSAGTVLVRAPYGRRFPFSALFGSVYAARGYHVLFQSVRGTFGSGGEFAPMVDEVNDGADTVAWMREQPWFTGSFATPLAAAQRAGTARADVGVAELKALLMVCKAPSSHGDGVAERVAAEGGTVVLVDRSEIAEEVAAGIDERAEAWRGDIPTGDDDRLWDWIDGLDDASRLALLAHCVSYGVNALYERLNPYSGSGVSQSGLDRRMAEAEILSGRLEVVAPELPMEIRLYRNPARGRGLAGRVWNAATTLPQGYADSE